MKIKKNLSSLSAAVLTGILTLVGVFLGHRLSEKGKLETRSFQSDKEALADVLAEAFGYADVYTVDWDYLEGMRYTQYKCPGLEEYLDKIGVHPAPCDTYDLIQKAKIDFHKRTIKARVLGSVKIVESLDEVESGFDEVLNLYFTREYYMRLFRDTYQEVMPARFEELERVFREELK